MLRPSLPGPLDRSAFNNAAPSPRAWRPAKSALVKAECGTTANTASLDALLAVVPHSAFTSADFAGRHARGDGAALLKALRSRGPGKLGRSMLCPYKSFFVARVLELLWGRFGKKKWHALAQRKNWRSAST